MDQLGDDAAVVLGGLPEPADLGKVILVATFGKQVIESGQPAGKFIGVLPSVVAVAAVVAPIWLRLEGAMERLWMEH